MCGINFCIDKAGQGIDPERVKEANKRIRHRGPDDERIYLWNNLAMGFVRLSIVDLETGMQPFFSEDRQKVLICNGEIYNYHELKRELIEKGHQFCTKNDCEVILHLYEDADDTFVQRLEGMFAFILVDKQKGIAIIARDRTGMKPLFFYDHKEVFCCSSEIKGLIPLMRETPGLNARAIMDAFTFGYPQGGTTVYSGIHHVPPAEIITLNLHNFGLHRQEYWQPNFIPKGEKSLKRSGDHGQALNLAISRAVHSHTQADVPIGSYLSGGIDSTVITTLLAKDSSSQLNDLIAFSIKFPDSAYDESPIFERTIRDLGIKSQVTAIDRVSADDFIAGVRVTEQPQFTAMDVPMQKLAALVRENQRKVILAGEGSDELFGGYVSFVLNQVRRALAIPLVESLRPMLLKKAIEYFLGRGELVEKLSETYLEPGEEVQERFGTFPAWYPWWVLDHLTSRSLFKMDDYDPLGEDGNFFHLASRFRKSYDPLSEYDKSLYLEIKTRLPYYILSRADRNSMASSVEVRMPFLDNHVIDSALSIPEIDKMFAFREKYILRKSMQHTIPKHIFNRRKFGYSTPISWIWDNQSEVSRELLSVEALIKTDIFNVNKVLQTIRLVTERNVPECSFEYIQSTRHLTGVLGVQALALAT